ncbi:MAG TPA: 2-succinyl-6-hydroxy-2,4-cyclohexadiene-1-carboxylate synthase [Polyangiaceae bacterium]|jgi:2-succinyl-6-hydroxy-2,4-cyclohexadiene-1-carboxylate synthase|nr:2-succinyl-6-hydroxy-2,4-cyclohexadiene-1-carboxylate synthase [Polyangiaceae bacterium]
MTTTVALLHGFTGSPNSFRKVTTALVENDFRVEAPPLVGHGALDDASVTDFEGEVERLARQLRARAERMHLVGYSLGGRMAIGLLCRHPGLFTGATLVSAQPGLTAAAARLDRRAADETWCNLLKTQGVEAFVDAWEEVPLFASQTELPADVRDAQRAERLAHDPNGLVRSLRTCGLGEMPSYWEALSAIRVPTTLVVGSHDAKFAALAEQMRDHLPQAKLRLIPDAGHNVVLEKPSALLEILLESLGGA